MSTIRVCNNLGVTLELTSAVSPDLGSADWKAFGSPLRASPEHLVDVLEFNRSEGITNGKTWTFTTAFVLDGVHVFLQERITGTLIGSTMSQCMTAGSVTTGFVDTNDTKSITFSGASGSVYELRWDLSPSLSSLGYMDVKYTVIFQEPTLVRVPPALPQIETVVMMMFENRSLDTVLGWLYSGGAPKHVYPPGSSASFDGITPEVANYYETTRVAPAKGTAGMLQPCRVPNFDPDEEMPYVKNQLYADAFRKLPSDNPWDATPTMTGFVSDYHTDYTQDQEVMGAYSAEQLPVLYGLAQSYAVSDRWFASVPSQTDPNRAFSICGTSLGAETNADMNGSTFAFTNTIFNVLGQAGKTWGIYWQSVNPLASGTYNFRPYTPFFFPRIAQAKNGSVQTYKAFTEALEQGKLPNFCFLEPIWGGGMGDRFDPLAWVGIQGNDYHPPAWIGPAEHDLNALFEAIVKSPQWPNMLLIITFDEHGGTWDHVPPPKTVAPDDIVGKSGFKFERLGVRVPTILVSPFIPEGTVFRSPDPTVDYDHTSFLATLLKWAGVDPKSAGLGRRVAVAPTFEGVLSENARQDVPTFTVPDDYAKQGALVGSPKPLTPPETMAGAARPSMLIDVRAFREACLASETADELHARLQALLLGHPGTPPGGTGNPSR